MDKKKTAAKLIQDSKYLVCMQGVHLNEECGCQDYRSVDKAYDVELKYGCAPEEMFNASFYNTRVEKFFEYYKDEVIKEPGMPGPTVKALKKLEDEGILKSIVTREIFHLAARGGCSNVLELHGNIYDNICPRCQTSYPLSFMQNCKGLPICPKCNVPVRPHVCLIGEMLDNGIVTRAADEIGRADVLLILQCNLNDTIFNMLGKYFKGDKIILIHEDEHYMDHMADLVIYGKSMDVLPELVDL